MWPFGPIKSRKVALDDLVRLPQLPRALLDDGLEFVEVALQRQLLFLELAAELVHLDRSAQRRDEVIPVDGLPDEVVGPGSEGLHHQVVLAVPVIIRVGVSGRFVRISANSSRPSIPGILMSVTIAS